MERFYGFDLGDAESAVARLSKEEPQDGAGRLPQPAAGGEPSPEAEEALLQENDTHTMSDALRRGELTAEEYDTLQQPEPAAESKNTRQGAKGRQTAGAAAVTAAARKGRQLPEAKGTGEKAKKAFAGRNRRVPEVITVAGAKSFITAYATLTSGELVIGENACFTADAVRRKIRFKSRFLTDQASHADVKSFAAGVLAGLIGSGELIQGEDCCFYIGCPAGWDRNTREQYRQIFESTGYPPVRIVSESRAAMVSACQSKHLQVGYDILSRPVLVIDIGSSTTDFAYICGGHEVQMQTAGEVMLGGGIMDETLLEEAVASSSAPEKIRKIFEESEPWKNYCEFAARRLKEKYYSDPEYFRDHDCAETVMIYYRGRERMTIRMSAEMADRLENKPVKSLSGKSFYEVFHKSLINIREEITGEQPELVFLTGGVSKLPSVRDWCMEVFPDSVIISGAEPEFSVARGLAWSGKIDDELRAFREELEELKRSTAVEDIVGRHIRLLYRNVVDALVGPIMEYAAIPVFDRWRNGQIKRLSDTDGEMQQEIEAWLRTDEARELLGKVITRWLKPMADQLEEYTVPICVRHNVPYTALSLKSFFAATDIDIQVNAKDVFAVEEVTLMIDSLISIFVGLLCGGSGIALISSGPTGIIAGIIASLLVLLLGKHKMENALLKMNLPKPVRKLVPKNAFRSRMQSVSDNVRERVFESLNKERNEEITARLVDEISQQIEQCLTRMAEVVEIPLGS